MGVSLCEISRMDKRETAQTTGQGPEEHVKWKRMWDFEDS